MSQFKELDLNIDNYSLEDIVKLFKISYELTEKEMVNAKKITLSTHPDKSGLDRNIFIFFKKAYDILYKIYNLREKKTSYIDDKEYELDLDEEDKKEILKKIMNKKGKDFNVWFNTMFENIVKKEEHGYGDWIKSNKDIEVINVKNKAEMDKMFLKKKKECKELINFKGVKDMEFSNGTLINELDKKYQSNVFSKLGYDDLKRAHVESVIPVTMEDYEKKKKYNNVEEYKLERSRTNINALSKEESRNIMKKRERDNNINSTHRIFDMLKEDERMRKINNKWWSTLKQLK